MDVKEIKELMARVTLHNDSDDQWDAIAKLDGCYGEIIQTLLKRVEELGQTKKDCLDRLKLEMLANGNPRNCYGCAGIKAILDS